MQFLPPFFFFSQGLAVDELDDDFGNQDPGDGASLSSGLGTPSPVDPGEIAFNATFFAWWGKSRAMTAQLNAVNAKIKKCVNQLCRLRLRDEFRLRVIAVQQSYGEMMGVVLQFRANCTDDACRTSLSGTYAILGKQLNALSQQLPQVYELILLVAWGLLIIFCLICAFLGLFWRSYALLGAWQFVMWMAVAEDKFPTFRLYVGLSHVLREDELRDLRREFERHGKVEHFVRKAKMCGSMCCV